MADDNPFKFGTNNWYKYEIREMTRQANHRFETYIESDYMPRQLERWKDRLLAYSGKPNPFKTKDTLGLGFSGKRKNVLKRQFKELKHFLKVDVFTNEGVENLADRERKAYESFNENNLLDWNYDKWKRMVDTFGNIDQELLNSFGYEDHSNHNGSKKANVKKNHLNVNNRNDISQVTNSSLVNAYSYAYDNNIDILSLMNQVDKEMYGKGADPRRAIDKLWDKIREEVAAKEEEANG